MAKSKDLFDDSTMSFGEHLEVLRVHLWKAIIGLVICVILALFFGNYVVAVIRRPIDAALQRSAERTGREYAIEKADEEAIETNFLDYLRQLFKSDENEPPDETKDKEPTETTEPSIGQKTIVVTFNLADLARALHQHDPENYPPSAKNDEDRPFSLALTADEFGQIFADLEQVQDYQNRPITLTVQEAFITYLKVAFVTGFVLASPWVFYQVWLFVAAGLYPHEQRYIYIYLPLSLGLFIGGALFCFFLVFPFVLDFLLSFNAWLGVSPQIRLSEWISFAIMLPVMFGLSFQLPLVMLFLERISIFDVEGYRTKRRMSILVIAIISMLMTPADPMSMLLMMMPLILLYELGIVLCGFRASKSPFEGAEAV